MRRACRRAAAARCPHSTSKRNGNRNETNKHKQEGGGRTERRSLHPQRGQLHAPLLLHHGLLRAVGLRQRRHQPHGEGLFKDLPHERHRGRAGASGFLPGLLRHGVPRRHVHKALLVQGRGARRAVALRRRGAAVLPGAGHRAVRAVPAGLLRDDLRTIVP